MSYKNRVCKLKTIFSANRFSPVPEKTVYRKYSVFLICKHAVDAFAGMINKWKSDWIHMNTNDIRIVDVFVWINSCYSVNGQV